MGYDYVPLYLSMGLPGNRFPKLKSRWANFFDFSLLCPTTTIPKNVFNYYWFILLKELGGPNEITGGLPIGEPWCRGMWEIPRPLMMYLWCFVPVTAPAPACMRWVTSSSQPPVSLADYRHSSRAWPGRPDNESNTGTSECLCQPCLPALLLPTCLCTLLYWLSLSLSVCDPDLCPSPRLQAEEEEVLLHCLEGLALRNLSKEPSVRHNQMIPCCRRLLEERSPLMEGLRVEVSHFYSVMQDGDLCIPWDWKGWGDRARGHAAARLVEPDWMLCSPCLPPGYTAAAT